jgi:unsaturated chondroitin disaccharide hydrolase
MERTKTNGRILLRPPLMQTREQFEERLGADVAQFANPPEATRIPLPPAAAPPQSKTYDDALRAILSRIRTVTEQGKGRFWFSSDPDGAPAFVDPKRNWGDGYWVSLLWDGFRVTGDQWFRDAAIDANRRILGGENREFHVTGLNYWNGSARSYRETNDGQWRESALRSADTMARIADPVTGLIPEYGRAERRRPEDPYDQSNYVKIDALVGLPILWWAYEETHEKRYLDTANRHLRFTLDHLVEPDGAALQMLWHDPATARILGVGTHQGYGGNSRWARGLAWLLDGLPDAYRTTHDPAYRAQFERSARWLEHNLPEDLISWYDFDDQGIFWRYRDSGTSAICAYGLLRMSELEPDRTLADSYRRFGIRLVNALLDRSVSPVSAADARPAGMLVGQTYTKPQEGEFIWGTYSLVRSLCWLRKKGIGR